MLAIPGGYWYSGPDLGFDSLAVGGAANATGRVFPMRALLAFDSLVCNVRVDVGVANFVVRFNTFGPGGGFGTIVSLAALTGAAVNASPFAVWFKDNTPRSSVGTGQNASCQILGASYAAIRFDNQDANPVNVTIELTLLNSNRAYPS